MKRRNVLTTAATLAVAGCSGVGENGATDAAGTEATAIPPKTASTDAGTRADSELERTATGTDAPRTVRETGRTTVTATDRAPSGTPQSPVPIPDAPTDREKTPLTGEASVTLANGGSRVVVSGTIVATDGCQTVVLDSVRRNGSTLRVTVATERERTTAACAMALIDRDYRFVVNQKRPPESVTVVHRGAAGEKIAYSGAPGQ